MPRQDTLPPPSDSRLDGWGDPLIDADLKMMQTCYQGLGVDSGFMDKALRRHPMFKEKHEGIITDDTTEWAAVYQYDLPSGAQIALLVPKKNPDNACEQSVTAYARLPRGIAMEDVKLEIERLLAELTLSVED